MLIIYTIYQNQKINNTNEYLEYLYKITLKNLKNNIEKPTTDTKFKKYSGEYEDLILYGALYDIKEGFYIDVGSNSPTSFSVTKAFYDLGWRGINIEPLQDKYKELILERPNDINLGICAGENDDEMILYEKGPSTTTEDRYNRKFKTNHTISVLPLSNITKLYVPKNTEIDFCKIDVEGAEKKVLLGYDFVNYRPKVFCIEATKPETKIPTHDEWEYILFQNNYTFAYAYGVNRYYVDNRFEGLKNRFIGVKKLKKKFMKRNYLNK